MIRNEKDLCELLGVDNWQGVERRVYKDTDCGAWIQRGQVNTREGQTRAQVWVARIHRSITGPRVVAIRRRGDKAAFNVLDNRRGIESVPQEVLQYLLLTDPASQKWNGTFQMDCTNQFIQELKPDVQATGDCVLSIRRAHGTLTTWVTFRVNVPLRGAVKDCVRIGSIVEGTDACVDPEALAYPFTGKAFYDMLKVVDAAADDIWNQTHGCEHCGIGEGDLGGLIVNPECKRCGGHGEVI